MSSIKETEGGENLEIREKLQKGKFYGENSASSVSLPFNKVIR